MSGDLTKSPALSDWRDGLETGVLARVVEDWSPFMPDGEAQYLPKKPGSFVKWFDSNSCVSFSVSHSLEAQANYLLPSIPAKTSKKLEAAGFIVNGRFDLSPRHLAAVSGTTIDGNAYAKVLEAARKTGMVPGGKWKMEPTMRSFADWIAYPPAFDAERKLWLETFDLKWDWIFWAGDAKTNAQKLDAIGANLPTCPILVGRPWCPSANPSQVKEGVPIRWCGLETSGHATVIYGMEDDSDQLVLDTYPPFRRVFDDGYWIQHAFRAVLTLKEPAPEPDKPTPPTKTTVYGERSGQVRRLQECLSFLGHLKVSPTGYYGDITADAVRRFQRESKIAPVPRSAGPKTRAALRAAL